MTILRTGLERIKGAFKVLIGGAAAFGLADIIKNVLKEQGIEAGVSFIKTLASGKGLGNEAVYGTILDRCKLTNEERSFLIRAIEEMRHGKEEEKEAANNFIILVALGDPDKSGKRPGERTLHGFVHRITDPALTTDAAKLKMLKDNIVHIGTNAEVKTQISIVQKWAVEAWEKQIKPNLKQINKLSKKYKRSSKKALRDFEERPLWKKILFN